MRITLCNKVLVGDIPTCKPKSKDDANRLIDDWIGEIDLDSSVVVCFQTWNRLPMNKLRNEQGAILVSHIWDDILDFSSNHINEISYDNIDFAIFEFENYQDALGYCKDLKESF